MARNDPNVLAADFQKHALKRMADPDEIARAARFLLSGEASFITGSCVLVDGGNSISKMQLR